LFHSRIRPYGSITASQTLAFWKALYWTGDPVPKEYRNAVPDKFSRALPGCSINLIEIPGKIRAAIPANCHGPGQLVERR